MHRLVALMTRGLRRLPVLLVSLGTVLAVAAAPAASASGYDDVRLAVPGTDRVRTLGADDPVYAELAGLVAVPADGRSKGPGVDAIRSAGVTLTWSGTGAARRVDRVFLVRGGVWVSTREASGPRSLRQATHRWHRPESPARLVALLEELGLAAPARGGERLFPELAGYVAPDRMPPVTAERAAGQVGAGPVAGGAPVWVLLAAGLGILLLAGTVPLPNRVRARLRGAEQVPDRDEQPPAGGEQLSWPPRR